MKVGGSFDEFKDLLDALVDILPLPFFFRNEHLLYKRISKKYLDLLGKTRKEVIGKSIFEIWGQEEAEFLYKSDLDLKSRKDEFHSFPLEITDPQGIKHNLRILKRAIFDKEGKFRGILGLVDDISDQTQIQKKLAQLNKDKDTLLSIISHDLRGPLANMISLLKIQEEFLNNPKGSEAEKIHHLLKENAKVSFDLLDKLLMWARNQSDQLLFHPEEFDLYEVTCQSFDLYMEMAKSKGITLTNKIPKDCHIYADKNMILTVIRNLLSNAIKYTHSGGTIRVNAKEGNPFVVISFKDSGVGMSKEQLDKVFSIDKKVSTPGTSKEKGTGLGLILCKNFIERNNGRIEIKSTSGKGTDVIFTLVKSSQQNRTTFAA
ncbi:PAS domain-containing sensor histidine kinase [Xanthovirga aplysinae]|uniref:PAS domain-containing sensor histidine kinase n=1 Tax=Xanthovirga aplysinae TaxID=2529853 RepID=UPI0012BBACA8|nr:PAS domain-containing sensor histidine kinase [Xanthovirga aplysinae]MTI29419.1 PAS domain-containing sensor histidine kinase [Xanthovirga aplysinae]